MGKSCSLRTISDLSNDRHFRLIDRHFRLIACKLGDVAILALLAHSEPASGPQQWRNCDASCVAIQGFKSGSVPHEHAGCPYGDLPR